MSLIRGNLLDLNQQSNEDAATEWTSSANATLAVSSTQAFDGLQSLQVTATATATTKIVSPQIPVQRSSVLYAEYWTRAATTGRATLFFFDLYNNGTFVSTPTSPAVTNTTSSWVRNTWQLKMPTATTQLFTHFGFGIQMTSTVAAEVHYFDRMFVTVQGANWRNWIGLGTLGP